MLPKFLIADNSLELPNTIFVVHTEAPRFIVESDIDDFEVNQQVHWIDEAPAQSEVEELMTLAENFLEDELEHQSDLFDEEIGEE